MLSQNLLNLVDSFMIGKISKEALAAVAAGGVITWLSASIVISLSTGVQQLSSRRYGEQRLDETAHPLNAGLITALLIGVPMGLTLCNFTEEIMRLISNDEEVVRLGSDYLYITFLGIPFNGLNFCFRGFWNGINKQKIYMYTLFIIHSINIILNYLLIFGKFGFPELGVTGAALATMLSLASGTVIYTLIAFSKIRSMGFFALFPKQVFSSLFKLSTSNAIQSFLYALSYNVIYKVIAQLGTNELAAAGIVINFALVFYLPGLAFGLVATSLVGQEIGRKDFEAANNWTKDISKLSSLILGIASIPLIIFPEFLLDIFIKEKEAVVVAIDAVRILGVSIFIEAQALTMMHALLGAGDSKKVMYISTLLLWIVYIPMGWLLGIYFDLGLNGIWTANLIVQISMAVIYTTLWKTGKWKEIRI
ncbi:MAG: MATE family efflux transporter [Lentisphaeraceae bacterium]|nr:MATE family efflux transporter [Lentisphaeraceae bacterium]